MNSNTFEQEAIDKARALLLQVVARIDYAELTNLTVYTDGYGSRPGKGTHTLLGHDLPVIDHSMLMAASGTVTTPEETYQLKVTLEVPTPGWTDASMREVLGI